MKIKKIIIGVVIVLIFISALFALANSPIQAQAQDTSPEISKKLDDILKNQKEILKGIASIKDELDVIKIRVTR